jgi:GNAT superfamily N-acetyltransferase
MPVFLRELRDDEFPAWLEAARSFYVSDLERHAQLPRQEAEEKADRDYGMLFPDGKPTDSQHLFTIEDSRGEPVGRLFFAERSTGIWLYEIEIEERLRGRGFGREAMLAFEQRAGSLAQRR